MPKFLLRLDIQFFASSDDKSFSADSLKKLQEDFTTQWGELKTLLDTQADEMRTHGETTTQTASSIKSVETKIGALENDLKGATQQIKEFEAKFNRPDFGGKPVYQTAGERFVESDAYKNMVASGANGSQPFEVGSFFKMFQKDLNSTDPKGGILVAPQVAGGIVSPMDQQLRMRDILNVQGTTSNAIEYIQETGFTNASAPVAEKALSPESDITFDSMTATVKTINHWIPATRQILSDATQLEGYINSRLIYGLKLTEENQLLYGSGTGENLQGLMTTTGVQVAPAMGAEETRIDRIRRSITLASVAGYPVTGIILSPADWEAIELAKGTDGRYIWVNVPDGGVPRLWRVPVVESLAMQDNEYILGAFGLGASVFDREQANIRVSESHADFFLRNQVAIMAQERIAMAVYRPEAFVRGTFTATV